MDGLEGWLIAQGALFVLVLGRVGALVATAPLLSGQMMPMRVRAMLAVALTLVVSPLAAGGASDAVAPPAEFLRMLTGELLAGALLGLGVTILLSGAQVAGQLVSQLSGMSFGDVVNPASNEEASLFSQLFYFVTLAVFVAIGGHRLMIQALLDTFRWAPPGRVSWGDDYADALITLLGQSFNLGVRAAAPMLVALFLATVLLGLVSRTLPQINAVVVGFSVNSLLTLGMMMVSVGAMAYTFQEPLADSLVAMQETIRAASE
ncbi:flagellar biosynthesis protein FliR [Pirellulimonas nuda]|uniref:Flagellar biosynthesis protein FliR n=1 Tax=Pirellulimonas nuda TaxID=2528009 RepID=A0A518D9V7_9BACT|nr:flagellar biosynthetic protein FliR [Pirellulimonas nuda]QDU88218.1 flagellar biosynthesis protein FliR [Pirellulimonas nuda]